MLHNLIGGIHQLIFLDLKAC